MGPSPDKDKGQIKMKYMLCWNHKQICVTRYAHRQICVSNHARDNPKKKYIGEHVDNIPPFLNIPAIG